MITNLIAGLLVSDVCSELGSICPGNRNWLIFIRGNRVIYAGRYGHARDFGFTQARLCDMAKERHIWLKYTYKKDFDNACKIIAECMEKEGI